jgi:CBS domain-containing protein
MEEKLNVGDICSRDVVFTDENMSLKQAAGLMRDQHVGSLVVVRETDLGRVVVGMLTDRDITIIAVARDFDPQTLKVADIMSAELVTARPTESVNEVLSRMRTHGIRRVPVTTEQGVLVGIVTLDDLLEVMAEEMNGFVQAIGRAQKREGRIRV